MNYKEIVTKAVIAKGKKTSTNEYTLETENIPNTILGCWVINHSFSGTNIGGKILIQGSFDVNVWYSYDADSKTAVSTQKFSYSDTVKLHNTNIDNTNEVIVKSIKQPTVSDVSINNGIVNLSIDKELGIEIVGDTKIKVPTEEVDNDYEILDSEDEIDKEVDKVNPNYLEK